MQNTYKTILHLPESVQPTYEPKEYGVNAYRSGNYFSAIESLVKARTTDYQDWESRLYLAMAYGRAGLVLESLREFMQIVQECPDAKLRKKAIIAKEALSKEIKSSWVSMIT
jgi:hypothetical protein